MPNIKAFSKEFEKALDKLAKKQVVHTKDMKLTRGIGRNHTKLLDEKWLEIGRIDRSKESVIIKPEEVVIFPKHTGKGLRFYFERLRL